MRFLITGINGFVGTHLAAHLVAHNHQVLGVSRSRNWERGRQHYPSLSAIDVLKWDLREPADPSTLEALQSFQPHGLIHLAAVSIPADCGADEPTDLAQQTNVGGTINVIELANLCDSLRQLLLASSCHVYDSDNPNEVNEDAPLKPCNGYGKTKRQAETLIESAANDASWNATIVRGFQQTGPLQSSRMLLPEWSQQFAERRQTIRVRSLNTTLDLMDIRDSVGLYRQLLADAIYEHASRPPCEVFNIGIGVPRTGQQIIEALCRASQYRPEIQQANPNLYRNPIADISKLRERLGDIHSRNLDETVQATLTYWQSIVAESADE